MLRLTEGQGHGILCLIVTKSYGTWDNILTFL